MPRPKNDIPTVTRNIRIPKDVYQWLQDLARVSDRSFNGQVNYIFRVVRDGAIVQEESKKAGE